MQVKARAATASENGKAFSLTLTRKLPGPLSVQTMARCNPAYSIAPFVRCGLPRSSELSDSTWERKRCPYGLKLETTSEGSLPYGQDALILILLATAAWQQKSCQLHLGTAYQMLRRLGLSVTGTDYSRLARRLARFKRCQAETTVESKKTGVCVRKYAFFEESNFWFERKDALDQAKKFENQVTISSGFYDDIHDFPIQLDMEIVRGLANAPGALDLSLYIAWRSHMVRSGRHVRVPLSGPLSLAEQLNSGPYLQDRDYRRQVRTWISKLKDIWPECPAVLTSDGSNLLICYGPLILPQQ